MAKSLANIRIEPARSFALEESVLDIDESADFLRVSRSALYRIVASGNIKTSKIGKRTIITGKELARFLRTL